MTQWLKNTEIYSLIGSGGLTSEIKVFQGSAPSKAYRETLCLSLRTSGGSGCSLACGKIAPTSAFVFTWPSGLGISLCHHLSL